MLTRAEKHVYEIAQVQLDKAEELEREHKEGIEAIKDVNLERVEQPTWEYAIWTFAKAVHELRVLLESKIKELERRKRGEEDEKEGN